jgi:cytoskeletal protein RodZ
VTTPDTNGPDEPTGQLTVRTAPPAAPRRWWSAVPHHLGRARTSTVVLALLFVGLYALYLNVRPPDPTAATTPTQESTVQTPAPSDPPLLPTGTPEPTTTAPAPTTTAPGTSAPSPTPPAETTGEVPPESAAPTTADEGATAPSPTPAAPTATGAPAT